MASNSTPRQKQRKQIYPWDALHPPPSTTFGNFSWLFVIGLNGWTIIWLVVFASLLVIFVVLAIFSNILRSPEPEDTGRFPYSLSRTQAAFWLFLAAISF